MSRKTGYAALAALTLLAAAGARAEIIQVKMTTDNPNYLPTFGGLSFDVNTAAATYSPTQGSCGGGTVSGVYQNMVVTGGVSNGSLLWNGTDYSLQNAAFDFEQDDQSCDFYLNMTLKFNNGTAFSTQDQVATGAFAFANYTPAQVFTTALLDAYNSPGIIAPFLQVNGQPTGLTGFQSTATPVPEPGTLTLLGAGLAGLLLSRRKVY
jgi:hypothetical protein